MELLQLLILAQHCTLITKFINITKDASVELLNVKGKTELNRNLVALTQIF